MRYASYLTDKSYRLHYLDLSKCDQLFVFEKNFFKNRVIKASEPEI